MRAYQTLNSVLRLSTAIGLATVMASTAYAQEAEPAEAAQSSDAGLTDIVVTATKTTGNLQDTAAAITSVTGDTLVAQGVVDIRGVQNLVPSVRFQPQNAATEIYLRGVGSTIDLPNIESPTSLNFNGIYIPREVSAMPFFDMQGVEVLPGPQGTLYGRGSLGGIVNASFARPTNSNEGAVLAEVGNFSLIHGSAMVNFAASPELAVRFAADYTYRDGYQKSGASSADDFAGRLSLDYKPNDTVGLYIWGQYVKRSGDSTNPVTIGVDPVTGAYSPGRFLRSNPWDDTRTPAMLALPANPNLPPPVAPSALPTSGETFLTGAELTIDLGGATITYIPSYMRAHVDVDYFFGAYQTDKSDRARQWTQELRLAGDVGPVEYLAGLYAYRIKTSGTFNVAGFPVADVDANRLKGYAIFGEAKINATDALSFTLGGRVSWDDRDGRGSYTGFEGGNFVVGVPYSYQRDFNHADFKVAVQYEVNPDINLYAAIQSGYQPGTFNTYRDRPGVTNAIAPAKLLAYTAGIKTRSLDNRLQINSEFFYYNYSDLFASAYNSVLNTTQTFNAQKVEIYGNQLDILFKVTPNDQLSLNVGYLHARNKRFFLPDGSANFNGLQLQYAPDWTVGASYYHDFELAGGSYIRAFVNSRFESAFYSDYSHVPGGRQSSYTKTDASITYYSADESWSIGAWIKNIEDEAVLAATAVGSGSPLQAFGATTNLEPPRTYGLRASVKF
ncbi:TonB-dependent receptor [Sphingopyxis lindanitolerans]|nr:TonB-dependent receptor [Sphingopyxis lindanitolerans]